MEGDKKDKNVEGMVNSHILHELDKKNVDTKEASAFFLSSSSTALSWPLSLLQICTSPWVVPSPQDSRKLVANCKTSSCVLDQSDTQDRPS